MNQNAEMIHFNLYTLCRRLLLSPDLKFSSTHFKQLVNLKKMSELVPLTDWIWQRLMVFNVQIEKSQNIADGARWSKYVWNIFFIVFSVVHFSYYQIYLIQIWKTFNIGALQTDKTFNHPWTMNWILNEMWKGNSGETLCAVAFGTVLAVSAALAEMPRYVLCILSQHKDKKTTNMK